MGARVGTGKHGAVRGKCKKGSIQLTLLVLIFLDWIPRHNFKSLARQELRFVDVQITANLEERRRISTLALPMT